MSAEDQSPIARKIRELAAKLAEDHTLDNAADAEEYQHQIECGLAEAVVDILDFDLPRLFYWFGFCFISFGVDPTNERISALLDALENEVSNQSDAEFEKEKGEEGDEWKGGPEA